MRIVILSKHPSGNINSEGRMQGCIQATVIKEIEENAEIIISSKENRPLLLVNENSEEILSQSVVQGSGMAPQELFPQDVYERLEKYNHHMIGFSRLGGDPVFGGVLTLVSRFEYTIKLTIPKKCLLPYEWPVLPSLLAEKYEFEKNNLGLASFWRITRSCYDKQTRQAFVLKTMPRIFIARGKDRAEQVLLELDFLRKCQERHIISSQIFEDENHIYILQECSILGDCDELLKSPISVNAKRFIFREMALALKNVHDTEYVHNHILIDRFKLFFTSDDFFQVKLMDFGYLATIKAQGVTDWWAYDVLAGSANTNTVSPERLLNITTNQYVFLPSSDVYSLGRILKDSGFVDPIVEQMLDQNPASRPTLEKLISVLSTGLNIATAVEEIKFAIQRLYPNQNMKYLSERRHSSPAAQREYDQHFGLALRPNSNFI